MFGVYVVLCLFLEPFGHLLGKGSVLGCHVCRVLSLSQMCPGPYQNKGQGWRREASLSPLVLLTVQRRYFICGSFMFFSVLCMLCLCARLFICAWEKADLLALVCGVYN